MTPSHSLAIDGWSGFERPKPLASWYTEGLSDGVGDRLLMFDNSGTPSLELLRFRPVLATASGFEEALRERVDALSTFEHRAFACVRAVERLEGGDLALVSTFTTGRRVAEIFWNPQARTGVHPAFAAWLIRELIGAVADLHRQGKDIAHTGLSPDRVILTRDGRLMIVEHVLGAALDRLHLPLGRLWQVLGLVAIQDNEGFARLDQRTDVVQIGWIALSLLLGRRLPPGEYPRRVDALVDDFVRASRGRSPVLVAALRAWLERALHTTGDPFESAIHAQDGLGDLQAHGGPHAVAFAASRTPIEQLAFEPPPLLPPIQPVREIDAPPVPAADRAVPPNPSLSEARTMAMATEFDGGILDPAAEDAPAGRTPEARRPRSAVAGWLAAAAFVAIAGAEAAWIARVELAPAGVALAAPVPITLDSLQAGDMVIVDGREVGVTPLALTLTQNTRSIRVRARPPVDVAEEPAPAPAVERPATNAAVALALAAARDKRGGLRISSPIELQVLEGERVLGSSVDGPIVATAGRHELDFVNSAFGYRSRQLVDIKAGQIVPMRVSPPDGRVSVNAVPWAQVSINGNPIGETPLANLPIPVGEHEITFRHPQLGEQTQKVIIKSNALTRVSATFSR